MLPINLSTFRPTVHRLGRNILLLSIVLLFLAASGAAETPPHTVSKAHTDSKAHTVSQSSLIRVESTNFVPKAIRGHEGAVVLKGGEEDDELEIERTAPPIGEPLVEWSHPETRLLIAEADGEIQTLLLWPGTHTIEARHQVENLFLRSTDPCPSGGTLKTCAQALQWGTDFQTEGESILTWTIDRPETFTVLGQAEAPIHVILEDNRGRTIATETGESDFMIETMLVPGRYFLRLDVEGDLPVWIHAVE